MEAVGGDAKALLAIVRGDYNAEMNPDVIRANFVHLEIGHFAGSCDSMGGRCNACPFCPFEKMI